MIETKIEEKQMQLEEILGVQFKLPDLASQKDVRAAGKPFSKLFDHTLLKVEAGKDDFRNLCAEARALQCHSVCIPPKWVTLAAEELEGSDVKVCTVIGFPAGYSTTQIKAYETQKALEHGAVEFDVVMAVGALKDGNYLDVYEDIKEVVLAASGELVKVILEMCFLNGEEKIVAGLIALCAGATFLKTSTGFGPSGATIADVQLLRKIAGNVRGVKAAGGIRDKRSAEEFMAAGADRIGASATVNILKE